MAFNSVDNANIISLKTSLRNILGISKNKDLLLDYLS